MIKFQQSQALTSHFESFWSIVQMKVFCKNTRVYSQKVCKFRKWFKLCKENNTYIRFRKAGLSIKEKAKTELVLINQK